MIILSGVLVVLAIALLVAGIVAGADGVGGIEGLTLIYISIGISVVSALCLLIGVFLRRKELFGPTGAVVQPKAKAPKPGKAARLAQQARAAQTGEQQDGGAPAPASAGTSSGAATLTEPFEEVAGVSPQAADVPPDAAVFVVRGRKRYHLESCRQLAGRDKEELTYEEAIEEGFSPCTACMPDTALAARAAVTVGESSAAASGSASADAAEAPTLHGQEALSAPLADELHKADIEDLSDSSHPLGGGYGIPAPSPAPLDPQPAAASPWETGQDDPLTRKDVPPVPSPSLFAPSAQPEEPAHTAEFPQPEPTAEFPKPAVEDEPPTAAEEAAEEAEGPLVRILSGTKRYHRPDCALIEDIGDEADDLDVLTRSEAKARGCTPCLVCQPDTDKTS